MVDVELLKAMSELSLPPDDANEMKSSSDTQKPSTDMSTAELEKMFLSPDQRFSDEWLNKLQQYAIPSHGVDKIDAGINHSNTSLFLCSEQRYHAPESDS
jgi:hypothetical protein